MKNQIVKGLAVLLLMPAILLAGCRKEPAEIKGSLDEWQRGLKLDGTETAAELYAAAGNEGTLTVYSTSTRIMDVARSFEKAYPGRLVEVVHLREGELYGTLRQNYETGNFAGDVVVSADGTGIMEKEFLPANIVVKYLPRDIEDKILPGYNEELLMFIGEATVFSYNGGYYPVPPVRNWWELTEEKWRGMVYLPNPVRSVTTLSFFCMIIRNSEMMARAYEDLYGRPPELPPGENAGREFIRRLLENDANIVNSSSEVYEVVGAPGPPRPQVGINVSSKTRLRELGYEALNYYGMEPFAGVYTPVNVMLAGGTKNPNTAKLFIRWLLGETDGRGEGYRPYLAEGAWSVRSDVADDTEVRCEDLNLLQLDKDYLYENREAFLAFWEELLEGR